jgi:hypothetical protein
MNPERALQEIGVAEMPLETFSQTLFRHGLRLEREKTTTLQINVGNLCNQSCRHCHLNAGPDRREIMNSETVDDVISYAARNGFQAIDITGGARLLLQITATPVRLEQGSPEGVPSRPEFRTRRLLKNAHLLRCPHPSSLRPAAVSAGLTPRPACRRQGFRAPCI